MNTTAIDIRWDLQVGSCIDPGPTSSSICTFQVQVLFCLNLETKPSWKLPILHSIKFNSRIFIWSDVNQSKCHSRPSPRSFCSLSTVSTSPKVASNPGRSAHHQLTLIFLILNQVAIPRLLMLLDYFYWIQLSNHWESINWPSSLFPHNTWITWRIKYFVLVRIMWQCSGPPGHW